MHQPDFVLIMAGGVGASFWPLSSKYCPKQFLDILGTGQTMLQQTYNRFCKMVPKENIYVITCQNYTGIVEDQLPVLPRGNILSEPLRRNTAACIIYACFKLMKRNPGATLLVTPADHQILNEEEFQRVCEKGSQFVKHRDALVTLGIKPTYASTGYGYIQKYHEEVELNIYPVRQYIEKPYLELAKSFAKNDNFLWNSGIFIWKIKDILKACSNYMPGLYNLFEETRDIMDTPDEHEHLKEIYEKCQNISIDFGIMEKADNVFIIPASFEWCDLGTWSSAWENMEKDYQSNAVTGKNVMVIESARCVVHTYPDKIVVIEGLEDYIVADTKDGLLICRKEKEKEVRNYIAELKRNREEVKL
jgi:mannose-1-phosphate guanylyltransferase